MTTQYLHKYDRLHIALLYGLFSVRGKRREYIARCITYNAIDRALCDIWHTEGGF